MEEVEELKMVRDQLEETNKKLEKEKYLTVSLIKQVESMAQKNNKLSEGWRMRGKNKNGGKKMHRK